MTSRHTAELRAVVDANLLAALRGLAEASGRHPAAIVEDALKLVLDPLASLRGAAETVAAYRAILDACEIRQSATEDSIRVIADFVCDAMRVSTAVAVGKNGK